MSITGFAITARLGDWHAGDQSALESLIPLVYSTLRRIASRQMQGERCSRTLQPTELVHEVFLQLQKDCRICWEGRSHFFGIAARLMRQILVQRARVRGASKRGGGCAIVPIDADPGFELAAEDACWFIDLDEALHELHKEDARKSEIEIGRAHV